MTEPQKPEQTTPEESPASPSEQPAAPQQPTYSPNRLNSAADQPQPPQDPQEFFEQRELNSARTLAMVATIGGPVSFIIGGIALSSVALVCAIIALIKTKHVLANPDSKFTAYARALRQTAFMGIAISAVALVLNVVGVITMMPYLMEALQTGDYSSLLGNGVTTQAPSSGESAWG